MYRLFCGLVFCLICNANADVYQQLYQASGWPTHIVHFHDALGMFQKQYQSALPPIAYQAINNQIEQRFNAESMQSKAESTLKNNLTNPDKALAFFNSNLGKKIVQAETMATSKENFQKQNLPFINLSKNRQSLLTRLTDIIPYNQAALETSQVLTGSAKDAVEELFPGMGAGNLLNQFTPSKETIQKQISNDLNNTLANVYQSLSDQELAEFIQFAESSAGKDYYQAAMKSLLASLGK